MPRKNYTIRTYVQDPKSRILRKYDKEKNTGLAFRVLNYDVYTKALRNARVLEETDHIKDYCFECEPGRIKSAIKLSAKVRNSGGMGKHVLNIFNTANNEYIDPGVFMDSEFNRVPILWGLWRGNNSILNMLDYFKRDYFYIDHAYSARGHKRGNYRICVSSRFAGLPKEVCFDRLSFFQSQEEDKINLRKWRKSGSHIVVCPPSLNQQTLSGMRSWEDTVVSSIQKYTDRKIIVKRKDDDNDSCFNDAWCAVTDQSNVAYDALNYGIPIITLAPEVFSFAGSVGIENIEKPILGDREYLFNWLAYNQFTADEMKSGQAIEILSDIYG